MKPRTKVLIKSKSYGDSMKYAISRGQAPRDSQGNFYGWFVRFLENENKIDSEKNLDIYVINYIESNIAGGDFYLKNDIEPYNEPFKIEDELFEI